MAKPQNTLLAKGVYRLSRSQNFRVKGTFKLQKKGWPAAKAKTQPKKDQVVKEFGKKKQKRVIAPKSKLSYPTEAVPTPLPSRKVVAAARLRASITPGQVLILLAGRHKGKRVVFLKQLPSGLLMVTGPYKLNGVPLRRVNQAYVVATSSKVDISGVKVDAKFTDAYFKKSETKTDSKKTEEKLFATADKAAHKVDAAKLQDQVNFDKAIIEAVKKVPQLDAYLKSTFSLRRGEAPHQLKF